MIETLQPLILHNFSSLRVVFYGARPVRKGCFKVVVTKVEGIHREGEGCELDTRFIRAMGEMATRFWEPDAMILDFSELVYTGGKCLKGILDIGNRIFGNESLILAVVVGPKSKRAVRSLFRRRGGSTGDIPEWIYDDLDAAWSYVDFEIQDLEQRLFRRFSKVNKES
jgi:hypothetical protein